MPDIKEKLVELLRVARLTYRQYLYEKDCLMRVAKTESEFETVMEGIETETSFVADHLISNGVTIQKWISVDERLPDDIDDYLVVVKSKYAWETDYQVEVDVAGYNPYERAYIDGCWNTFNDWNEGQEYLHITHWMPLPEPPKGE